ncbi:hypothetical protein COLO4_36250 [Corchorus olitorius]|uniref:Hydroxyproline O-arabinosyltransferase-like domain-containing protein n=1 Tax=Corchorus olitorius TaxID=93759 RepID=A0A1R3GA80_9ROSI|nr:hypothetical protein COLO4_36250 [Corchorus olitorius]
MMRQWGEENDELATWLRRRRTCLGQRWGVSRVFYTPKSPDNLMDEIPTVIVDPLPAVLDRDLLEKIAPTWMNVSLKMRDHPETDKAFGWVLEMSAYDVASALHGVQHILRKDFMLQVLDKLDERIEGFYIAGLMGRLYRKIDKEN